MTAPWAAPARSRWFDRPPPADETPREGALRRDLLTAVEWAEGLVQVGWLDPDLADTTIDRGLHTCGHGDPAGGDPLTHITAAKCHPVYVVREAR